MRKSKINVSFDFAGGQESKEKWFRVSYAEMRSFSQETTLGELEQAAKEIILDIESKYDGIKIDFVKIGVMAKKDEKGGFKYVNR